MSTPLDCGDSACISPERSRGGMRTNGGCRCSKLEVAEAHMRIAERLLGFPSALKEIAALRARVAELEATLREARD